MPVAPPPTNAVPDSPGVYRFLGEGGRVLYVGKAKRLARRVPWYFRDDVPDRTRVLRELAQELTWVVCASETEALALEREWIVAKQPPFNVALREGGGYAGVSVSLDAAVPRLYAWRGQRPEGAVSFGPYPGAAARELSDALALVFGVRSCSDVVYRRAERTGRACVLAETGHCLAPCVARVSPDEHRDAATRLVAYLRRPDPAVRQQLEGRMAALAAGEEFESAARVRDQAAALRVLEARQRVVGEPGFALDAVALRRGDGWVGAALVRVRDGVLGEVRTLEGPDDEALTGDEVLDETLAGFASSVVFEPGVRLVGRTTRGLVRAARGERERGLLALAEQQAESGRIGAGTRPWAEPAERELGLDQIGRALSIVAPERIECIDISHTAGQEAAGSVVVLLGGQSAPQQFRWVGLGRTGGDDYAAIAEVVRRRVSGARMGLPELPDLLLIDGGPGQVAAAAEVLRTLGVPLALAGLAKRLEEVWLPGQADPVLLPDASPGLRVLQHARDLAHRHALGSHRGQRARRALRTGLDEVEGLGPSRRAALLARFGSLEAVLAASEDELATTTGVGPGLARRIAERARGATGASD